jgi:hypothetical protein
LSWTRPADLREQVQKLWDKGELLACLVEGESAFPKRLRLVRPSADDMTHRFEDVRAWAADLRTMGLPTTGKGVTVPLRTVERELRHRLMGTHSLPEEVWVDSVDAALACIGKTKAAQVFRTLVSDTRAQQPSLVHWLKRRPLQALSLASDWARLLLVVSWVQKNPRPNIYLRQVDISGVASKFIETNRTVLTELLDLALPPGAVEMGATGVSQFARRYGFADKPLRIRLRRFGERLNADGLGEDITLTRAHFAGLFADLRWPVRRVFITENEVNFLAFPAVDDCLVVFGSGYGWDALACAAWLHTVPVHYWGDLDTHGFAILDQLRAHFPHVESLLMDQATFMAHKAHLGSEPQAHTRDLPRLTNSETALYQDLRDQRWGENLRLEQEHISFGWLQQALMDLPESKVLP